MQELLKDFTPSNSATYLLAILCGLIVHYLYAKYNKRTAATSFTEYWLTETPGMSLATLMSLGIATGAILKSGMLTPMDAYSVFLMGALKAFVLDATISTSPPTVVPAEVAAAPAKPAPAQAGFSRLGFLLLLSVVAAALVGCATMEELFGSARILKEPPAQCVTVTKSPDGKEVKTVNQLCFDSAEAIAQANALLAAVDRTTLTNLQNGIWTKAEAQRYYDQTGKLGLRVDQANTVFGTKNFAEALTSANATKQVILLLQKEVAAQARKQ